MLLASTIGQIGHPFYVVFAAVLAAIYSVIPNYAIAIALLTLAVMLVTTPITLKGNRGMMRMQLLAPELKKIQARHKTTPGMSMAERQASRQALNEEMMAFYKENNVSPTGGCLPMLLQMPVFLILYGTVRGLTHVETIKNAAGTIISQHSDPLYVSHTSRIYRDIQGAHGALHAFGINLADSVKSPGLSWGQKTPYIALILVSVGLQYLQMKRLSGRNPAARQANPQMQQMQKVFPLIFAVIYISIPSGVNVYFIISNLFRVCQQELMYRYDPHLQSSIQQLRQRTGSIVVDTKATSSSTGQQGGFMNRLRAASLQAPNNSDANEPSANGSSNGSNNGSTNGSGKKPTTGQQRPNGQRSGKGQPQRSPQRPVQPRAAGKRPRRPR